MPTIEQTVRMQMIRLSINEWMRPFCEVARV